MSTLALIVRDPMLKLVTCLILLAGLGSFPGLASGQSDGSDQSDRSQSRRSRGGQGFDIESYLKRIDSNGNGVLDENEMSDRTKSFIERMGIETNRPVSISKVVEKVNKDREDRSKPEPAQKAANALKVPGFGLATAKTTTPIPGFQGAATSGAGSASASTAVSQEVEDRINQTLERYDRNKNGVLDADELKDARWGSPSPEESDTNRDGRLSRDELAKRYSDRSRFFDRSSSRRGDSNVGTSNQEDRSNSARDRFRSSGRSPGDTNGGRPSMRPGGQWAPGGPAGQPGGASPRPAFNSSSRTSFGSSSSSGSSSGSTDNRDKFKKYAEGLIKQYDKNGSNALEKDEIAVMRRPPKADLNGDGTITQDELIDSLSGKAAPSADASAETPVSADSGEARSPRTGSPRGPGGPGGPGRFSRGGGDASFEKLDVNLDKRIHMYEFSSQWDEKTVEEFNKKDRNGDGVITLAEWQAG